MNRAHPAIAAILLSLTMFGASRVQAQDWPQWRGPHRDNKVTGFTAPQTWPMMLSKKWTTKVGAGDASPVLVRDKLYVFSRQGPDEVTLCLNAADGKIVWEDKYASEEPPTRPAGGIHAGPRSTPAVADGKVCTLGVNGVLSCLDAATGKVVWRKDSGAWPRFFVSSSPLIFEGKCIAFLGGSGKGEVAAFDLTSGEPKWKWTGESPAYGSPVLMTVDGSKQIVTPATKSLVGIDAENGKLLWKTAFAGKYNSGTPIVDGQTVIYSSPPAGTAAFKIEKQADGFAAKELWKSKQAASQYNTPVLRDGLVFGLSSAATFYCMNANTGEVLWNDKTRRGQCGEIFDAGPVLLALTTNSELIAFRPSDKGYEELAKIKVADTPTWSYPIISGNRVFVKDRDGLTLWVIE